MQCEIEVQNKSPEASQGTACKSLARSKSCSKSESKSSRVLLSIGVGILGIVGCGTGREKTYPVEGIVVFKDGSHVKVGTVETKSLRTGAQARGTIDQDGRFTLSTFETNDGAVAGDHQVVVVQFIQVEGIKNYRPSTMGVVNRKHASYATSGLVMRVDPKGPNQVKLEVEGARAVMDSTKDHGHDPVPKDTAPDSAQEPTAK
jgi:hypothetical protein